MSNILTINCCEFIGKVDKQVNVGYVAGDSYGKDFEDGFACWSDFFQAYPTEQSLIDHVLSQDAFSGSSDCFSKIEVDNYDN